MRTCQRCGGMLIKYGFLKKERTQRYKCKKCWKMCSDAPNRVYGTLRSQPKTINLVIQLLCEGTGVRAAGRIAGCHRDTVLRILKHAGTRSYDLLKRKLQDVTVKHIEADEIWTYVLKKSEPGTDPEKDTNFWGDYYIYLGLEQKTKLLLLPTIGKRTVCSTERFANQLARTISGRFQLTTDGFKPYKFAMKRAFGKRIDFAQFYKEFNLHGDKKPRRFNPSLKDGEHLYLVRCGKPTVKNITTAHVERVNLSLRTFNRRFVRRTICFSKDEEYLAYSVYLFAAHYNFCRPHSAVGRKTTPAMASGLTSGIWKPSDLLAVNLL